MIESDVHDFHFVIDRRMKQNLQNLMVFQYNKGLSWVIRKILSVLTPVIKNEYLWGEQRMSKYMHVCNDPDEIREDIHLYIPQSLYRELKMLHQNLNVYSIAQLLRGFIRLFFEYVEVYKDEVIQELEKLCACWSDDRKTGQLTPREFVRQLLKIIRHLPGKSRPITIYDTNFSPFWVFLL
jgi:hypothetical protein